MKKSSLLIILVLVTLVITSVLVFKKKGRSGTLDEDARNFKYKDTAAITKIFMADKNGRQCTVERTENGWYVNKKFHVRSDAILTLLETIKHVEVKRPVAKPARENVLKMMTSHSIKVEIYKGSKLVKQYYVGHETNDGEGTHMLLTDISSGDNYDDPFVVFIPGFTGYLNTRYIVEEKHWRDLSVINYTPDKLKSIQYIHHAFPDSSFTIEIRDTKTFSLKNKQNLDLPFAEINMKQYLAYFQNLNCEAIFTSTDKKVADSLSSQAKPFASFIITTKNNAKKSYDFYYKFPPVYKNAEYGINYKYDPDRLYVNFDDKKEWAVIQYYVFGKLFVSTNYFRETENVKK